MCEEVPDQEDAYSNLKHQEGSREKRMFFAVFGFFVIFVKHIFQVLVLQK